MIGTTISHYKILEKLGQGGMGIVYKAQDTKLGRLVALKFLPAHLSADEEQKSRFILEAKSASSIDHANIGAIYEIDETPNGDLFIAMAYYEGQTLKQKIEAGQCSVNETIALALQIGAGLSKAHERGIIHRDLKPANILITNDGTPKIIDFGLAKLAGGMRLTRTGTSLGTVAYMSPEQTRGDDVGVSADIWSFGIILYEMLTAHLPFPGNYETAMMYSIVNEPPIPLSQFRTDVPDNLFSIIEKTLEKDPAKRFQHIDEVISALTTAKGNIETGIATTTSSQLATRLIHNIITGKKTRLGLAGLMFVIIIAAGWYFLRPSSKNHVSSSVSRSMAVLPFINRGDQEQAYFADGLTGDIIQELSKVPQMLVVSKKSSSLYHSDTTNLRTAAATLGVRFLLHGDLQLLPARLKIHAALYDNEKGSDIWQEGYEIARGEILTAKSDILMKTVEQLGMELPPGITKPTVNAEVYEPYLQGIYYRDKFTQSSNALAIEYFSEACRKDTSYLPAMINLANAKIEHYRQGWDKSEKLMLDAEQICQQILRKDSTNAYALAMMGSILSLRGNNKDGLALLLRAIDLDNNNAFALTYAATLYLTGFGEPAKGVRLLKKLEEIEPTDWLVTNNLGIAYAMMLRNYPEAIKSFRRSAELDPTSYFPYKNIGYVYERMGKFDSALANYHVALQREPMDPTTYESIASVEFIQRKFSRAESLLTTGAALLQGDPQVMYLLGVSYTLQGKDKNATRIFREGLQLVDQKIKKNPSVADHYAYRGLFQARLGESALALQSAQDALLRDSTNEEILIKNARIYSVMGKKTQMMEMFKRAKTANPEYDAAYLSTALDFERYRTDSELLLLARGE